MERAIEVLQAEINFLKGRVEAYRTQLTGELSNHKEYCLNFIEQYEEEIKGLQSCVETLKENVVKYKKKFKAKSMIEA